MRKISPADFNLAVAEYRGCVAVGWNRLSAEWHRHKETAENRSLPLEVRQQAMRFQDYTAAQLRMLQQGGPFTPVRAEP